MLAGLAALLGFSAFFVLIYGGSYRHEGLWLAFLITLFWIEFADPMPLEAGQIRAPGWVRLGQGAFILLLVLQLRRRSGRSRASCSTPPRSAAPATSAR